MNVINVSINFQNGICRKKGISVVSGDYNSTKIVFSFSDGAENGTKIFEMKSPSGKLVYADEIVDNEVILVGKKEEDGEEKYFSLFDEAGDYTFEVSLYEENSKLTSVCGYITAKKEQVIVDGEVVESQITLFDNLMQELIENIGYVENLDIETEKVGNKAIITVTKKDGTTEQVEIYDGGVGELDDYPTENSDNAVKSKGIKSYVDNLVGDIESILETLDTGGGV